MSIRRLLPISLKKMNVMKNSWIACPDTLYFDGMPLDEILELKT